MNANAARLEVLSAAVRAIAAALPRHEARLATQELRAAIGSLAATLRDPDTDAAVAGELAGILAAFSHASGSPPGDRPVSNSGRT